MAQAFDNWLERIERNAFTHAQACQWAHAVSTRAAHVPPLGKKTNLTTEEAEQLWDLIQPGVRLAANAEHNGRKWLERWGTKKLQIPDTIIVAFDHFTFHGHAEISTDAYTSGPGVWTKSSFPIYRIHTTDGREIDYFAVPMQSRMFGERSDHGQWWPKDHYEARRPA